MSYKLNKKNIILKNEKGERKKRENNVKQSNNKIMKFIIRNLIVCCSNSGPLSLPKSTSLKCFQYCLLWRLICSFIMIDSQLYRDKFIIIETLVDLDDPMFGSQFR